MGELFRWDDVTGIVLGRDFAPFGYAQFNTVDDVLPQNIGGRGDTCQWVEEVLSHPNCEDGVLLSE